MPYLVFIGCCLIWGSTFLAIRIGNEAVPPVWAATIRLVLAAPLLAGLVLVTRQHFPRGPALRGALLFGIFNFGANLSLLYWGERVVPSGIAAVLYATVPLVHRADRGGDGRGAPRGAQARRGARRDPRRRDHLRR